MRCPKCGSFLEDGKSKCFLCGFDANGATGAIQSEGFSNNSGFGSGSGFSTGMNNTGANTNMNSDYLSRKEAYVNRMKNYRDVDYSAKKGDKRDFIDIYTAHKRLFRVLFSAIGITILVLIIRYFYVLKTTPEAIKPLIGDLYYEVDESFTNTSAGNDERVYTKSGSKGTNCSISIKVGTNTTGDHVAEYYEGVKTKLAPETDKEGNILNHNQVFNTTDNELSIDNTVWYYMNVYYRSNLDKPNDFDILKYRYFTSMYKGYYYDIELVLNNNDDSTCKSSINNFINSLQFIKE